MTLTLSVSSSWLAPLHPKSVPLNVNPLWISAWHTFLCSTNFESCLEGFKINHGIAPPRLCDRDCFPLQLTARPGYELSWIFLKSVRQFLHSKITSVYCNKSAFPMIKFKGYIDVGDGCWRPNVLVTSLRCWWPIQNVGDRFNTLRKSPT